MNANENAVPNNVLAKSHRTAVPTEPKKLQTTLEELATQISAVAADMSAYDSARSYINSEVLRNWLHTTIKTRRMRENFFPSDLFADPAWDILLDLTLARIEARVTSVSSVCIAASVPNTTALRWLNNLLENGIVQRVPDQTDKRRHYIEISDHFYEHMVAFISKAINDSNRRIARMGSSD